MQANNAPKEISKIFENTLCALTATNSEKDSVFPAVEHHGNGILLDPMHVLTALHCVRGYKYVTVTNCRGEKSIMLDEQFPFDTELDLAIITIPQPAKRPIFTSFYKTSGGSIIISPYADNFVSSQDKPDLTGWLGTKFNNFANVHRVIVDMTPNVAHEAKTTIFNAKVRVGPGFSGSPIINDRGQLMSLVTHIKGKSAQELQHMIDFTGDWTNEFCPFIGPDIRQFALFIKKNYLDKREENPSQYSFW